MTQIAYSQSLIAGWLDSGYRLAPGQFTFSVPAAGSVWPGYGAGDEPFEPGYAFPDNELAAGFYRAIGAWDDIIAPDFIPVMDDATTRGEIRLAITDIDDDLAAYAYFPTYANGRPGDIWLNANGLEDDWDTGSYGLLTLVHEVGHTLGLDHSFTSDAAPESLDSVRYTVMSYNWIPERLVTFRYDGDDFFAYFSQPVPDTPMVLDIAAAQEIYGAETDTSPGDTVYAFDAFSGSLHTIYDAGGIDTIDLSGINFRNVVDLAPGAYSSIAMASVEEQIAYWTVEYPQFADFIREVFTEYLPEQGKSAYTFTENVAIALSTVIENVLGGTANDEISGNAAANVLVGNGGDDVIAGQGGADRLEGGSGNDQLYGGGIFVMPSNLASSPDSPVVPREPEPVDPPPTDDDGSSGGFRLKIGATGALLALPEKLALAATTDATTLRAGLRLSLDPTDDPLPAPDPEPEAEPDPGPEPEAPPAQDPYDDMLFGGAGNDLLMGGAGRDYHSGGSGADVFRFAGGDFAGATFELADVISDFSEAEGDRIDLSAIDALSGLGDNAFRFLGNAAFTGAGAELRTAQYAGFLLLEGDTSGDGIADFAIRLEGLTALSANAIIV